VPRQDDGVSRVLDRVAVVADVAVLLGIAVLHLGWAHGGSWPLPDRETLARNVLGVEPAGGADPTSAHSHAPALLECYAVSGALTAAAALVAGRPPIAPRLRRIGLRGVVAVLAARGLLGVTGRTRLVVPVATGQTFARLDRRYYGPLCLLLAGLSSRSLAMSDAGDPPQDVG
jgi:hypothetical protein